MKHEHSKELDNLNADIQREDFIEARPHAEISPGKIIEVQTSNQVKYQKPSAYLSSAIPEVRER